MQVNKVPQMDGIASVLQQWVDHTNAGAGSGVLGKNSQQSKTGPAGKSVGVCDAQTWLFGSTDD